MREERIKESGVRSQNSESWRDKRQDVASTSAQRSEATRGMGILPMNSLCQVAGSMAGTGMPHSLLSLNLQLTTCHSRLRRAAFTLLEIVVSTAVVAVLSLILLQIISSMLDATKAETARMDAYANGRAVLEMMARDIRQTWVENSSADVDADGRHTNNLAWGNVPEGTEMNWRSIYTRFQTNVVTNLPSINVVPTQIVYSGVIPVVRGSAESGLRVVGYGLSNGFLIRYQTVLENHNDNLPDSAGLWFADDIDPTYTDSSSTNTVSFATNGISNSELITSASGVTTPDFFAITYEKARNSADIIAGNIYWMKIDGPTTDQATNGLPRQITITMRAASKEIMSRVARGDQTTIDNLLIFDEQRMTNSTQLSKEGIREVTLTIPLR
ncbi:type II secretion system protein [Oscillatoria laete-virens NRMC-F 0139]|nr:type II secretion system protein [Oscillatoria laete-virens]MDL5053049.1 type II secretion system protein [Oscillatoria laete-virens NRMC-F 0139]